MNTEIVTEKVIDPAKGIPVLRHGEGVWVLLCEPLLLSHQPRVQQGRC